MGIFLVYIVKSSLCLALFYLFYRLLLSRETFHRFNRIALLGITLFSALLPLIRITVEQPMAVAASVMSAEDLWLMQQWNVQAVVSEESRVPFSVSIASAMVYLCGIAFLLLRNLWSLSRGMGISIHILKGRLESGAWLVIHRQQLAPFSWMKFVVVSQKDLDEGGRDILIHEQAHIAKGHSWDLLWMEICVWLQWFNPAAWLLKQEIQNIHEYEADEEVLRSGVDARQYQMLLIKKAVGARLYSIANSLNHSSLKKRITMMVRKKSNPWARAKYLYVLPLAAVAVAAFARPEISVPLEEISSVKVNDLSAIVEQPDVKKSVPAAAIRQEASSGKARLNMRVVDEAGKPVEICFRERGESEKLIEEFMLQANEAVAEFMCKREHPTVYRVHENPDPDKLRAFAQFARPFGYRIDPSKPEDTAQFQVVLRGAKNDPKQRVLPTLLLRSLARARYADECIGHYGLKAKFYLHFTSPIRRYPDMMVHRLLARYLAGGKPADKTELEDLCARASDREVVAAEAERASIKYKMVEFMKEHIGEEFEGHISGLTEWGVYVELDETHIEGMVSLREMEDDLYQFDENRYEVYGRRKGRIFTLGDAVRIRVKRADLQRRQLDFELAHDAAADSREDDVKGHAAIPVRRQSTSRPGKGGKTSRKGGKKGSKR